MSGREFNPISPAIWGSERFASVSSSAKLLLLYVMTSPHMTSAGGYRLPAGYAAEDTGCSTDEFTTALAELVRAGLLMHDQDTKEVYVVGWFRFCAPANQKHAIGAERLICKMASDALRESMEADFMATSWGARLTEPVAEVRRIDATGANNHLLATPLMRKGTRA